MVTSITGKQMSVVEEALAEVDLEDREEAKADIKKKLKELKMAKKVVTNLENDLKVLEVKYDGV